MLKPIHIPLLTCLCACSQTGQGDITITAYGESFVEDGIPASEVADDWNVTFTTFEITVDSVAIADEVVNSATTIDLAQSSGGNGHSLATVVADAGDYSDATFAVSNMLIEGTASKSAVTKDFSWMFPAITTYSQCETLTTVPEDGTATFQITIHADHFLYDSLVSSSPMVVFQPLADADTNADGTITQQELAATGIGSFDPGSAGGIDNLWDWLIAQSATLGHVDGEGHCVATPG